MTGARIFRGGSFARVDFPQVGAAPAAEAAAEAGPLAAAGEAAAGEARLAAELENVRREARDEAVKLYSARLEAALESANAIKSSLEKLRGAMLRDGEKQIVRLAVKIAEKIVRRKLDENPDAIFGTVSRAVMSVPKGETLLIRVSPADYERLQQAGDVIPQAGRLAGTLSMEVSAEVEPGGCVVITEAGAVNANPSWQLDLVEEALLKEISGGL